MRIFASLVLLAIPALSFGQFDVNRSSYKARCQIETNVTVSFQDSNRQVASGTNVLSYSGTGQALHGGRGSNGICNYDDGPDGTSLANSVNRFSSWTAPDCSYEAEYQLPFGYTESLATAATCDESVHLGSVDWCPASVYVSDGLYLNLEAGSGANTSCGESICDLYAIGSVTGSEAGVNTVALIVNGSGSSNKAIYFDVRSSCTSAASMSQQNYICEDPLQSVSCIGTASPTRVNSTVSVKLSLYAQKVAANGSVSKGKLLSSVTLTGGCDADSTSGTVTPSGIFDFNNASGVNYFDGDLSVCNTPNGPQSIGHVSYMSVDQFLYTNLVSLSTSSPCVVEVAITKNMN